MEMNDIKWICIWVLNCAPPLFPPQRSTLNEDPIHHIVPIDVVVKGTKENAIRATTFDKTQCRVKSGISDSSTA